MGSRPGRLSWQGACRYPAIMPGRMPVALTEQDWLRLVAESEGLAGGDILNIVINAAAAALDREGAGCTIGPADFLTALAATKKARQKIGAPPD